MNPQSTLPTNQGDKTIPEILDTLMYSSYQTNRDGGLTHEQLVSIGVGNDKMKSKYDTIKTISCKGAYRARNN